eukprot:3455873-Pyramimonas_sp.AAC.1
MPATKTAREAATTFATTEGRRNPEQSPARSGSTILHRSREGRGDHLSEPPQCRVPPPSRRPRTAAPPTNCSRHAGRTRERCPGAQDTDRPTGRPRARLAAAGAAMGAPAAPPPAARWARARGHPARHDARGRGRRHARRDGVRVPLGNALGRAPPAALAPVLRGGLARAPPDDLLGWLRRPSASPLPEPTCPLSPLPDPA